MKCFGYIYKTTCWLNGCIYVGQKHSYFKTGYLGSGKRLWNAIKKYGKEHFSVELIQYAKNQKELDSLERCCIATAKSILSKDQVFNIAEGGLNGIILKGENNPMYGRKSWNHSGACTEIHKKRNSEGVLRWYRENGPRIPWNLGLTKETDLRVAKYGRNRRKNKRIKYVNKIKTN